MSDKKVILIATMGASPAVLTETVWSLSHATLSVVPDEIVVLTPKNYADRLKKEILSGEESVWNRLLKELVKGGNK